MSEKIGICEDCFKNPLTLKPNCIVCKNPIPMIKERFHATGNFCNKCAKGADLRARRKSHANYLAGTKGKPSVMIKRKR